MPKIALVTEFVLMGIALAIQDGVDLTVVSLFASTLAVAMEIA